MAAGLSPAGLSADAGAMIALLLALVSDPAGGLRLIQADDEIVTWLDTTAVEQRGERVRTRSLRVRGVDQAFWVVTELDCAAGTLGQLDVQNLADTPGPALEGDPRHYPLRPYDAYSRSLTAIVCEGAEPFGWAPRMGSAQAAVAATPEVRVRGDAERPMALIPVGVGHFALYMDRETLRGGGPQWWVRTFQVTHADFEAAGQTYLGGWSRWEIDCGRMTVDRQTFASVRTDGALGAQTPIDQPPRTVARGDEAYELALAVCDPDVWTRPALATLDDAVAQGRAALDF
jgi:hypothetical protein